MRSLAALILIFAGWVTDPLSRLLTDSAECGMVCCTDDGADSCALHPVAEDGEKVSPGTSLGRTLHFSARCRGTCTSRIDSGRSHHQPVVSTPIALNTCAGESAGISSFVITRDILLHSGSAPRSPPLHS
ncbi:MAG: hypothetical protein ACOYLF_07715 [Blastocatellia bacterium]